MSEEYNPDTDFKTPTEAMNALVVASNLVADQRRRALKDFVLSALDQLGFGPTEHSSPREALGALEREYVEATLATISDEDPASAARMKRLVDHLLTRP